MLKNLQTGFKLMESTNNPNAQLFTAHYDIDNNCFLWVSANSKRLFGYTEEEMIGRPAKDFTEGENDEEMEKAIQKASETNTSVGYWVNVYVKKDGSKTMMVWGDTQKLENGIVVAYGLPLTFDMIQEVKRLEKTL